jgi:hypothetical protein
MPVSVGGRRGPGASSYHCMMTMRCMRLGAAEPGCNGRLCFSLTRNSPQSLLVLDHQVLPRECEPGLLLGD